MKSKIWVMLILSICTQPIIAQSKTIIPEKMSAKWTISGTTALEPRMPEDCVSKNLEATCQLFMKHDAIVTVPAWYTKPPAQYPLEWTYRTSLGERKVAKTTCVKEHETGDIHTLVVTYRCAKPDAVALGLKGDETLLNVDTETRWFPFANTTVPATDAQIRDLVANNGSRTPWVTPAWQKITYRLGDRNAILWGLDRLDYIMSSYLWVENSVSISVPPTVKTNCRTNTCISTIPITTDSAFSDATIRITWQRRSQTTNGGTIVIGDGTEVWTSEITITTNGNGTGEATLPVTFTRPGTEVDSMSVTISLDATVR